MAWLRHGFWNTLEHGVTRASDAMTTLVLLWALPAEIFARLALAQSWVAPTLLLFISPEQVLYRDFARWQSEGPASLAARLRALRLFAWGKGQLALPVAAALALGLPGGSYAECFFALVWAFSLALGPQIAGADREYLRLDLRLKELNGLSLWQKLSLLGGTTAAAFALPGRMDALAGAALFSVLSAAVLARWRVRELLRAKGADSEALRGRRGPPILATLADSLGTFSIWSHLLGVIANWIQTLDLFFLGAFQGSLGLRARELGLYAATLKLANFSQALPMALSNLFSVRLGREMPEDRIARRAEAGLVLRSTAGLGSVALVQGAAILALAPWATRVLSHGRWSEEEQTRMVGWLVWILGGAVLLTLTYIPTSWLVIRGRISAVFLRVSLPWLALALGIYGAAAATAGADGVARANVAVSLACVGLLLWFLRRASLGFPDDSSNP